MADQDAKEPPENAANVHESIEARATTPDAPNGGVNEASQPSTSRNPPTDVAPTTEKSPDPDADADGDIDMDVDAGTGPESGDVEATPNPSTDVTINLKDSSNGTAKVDENGNEDGDGGAAGAETAANTENKPAAKGDSEAGVEADAPGDSKEGQALNRLDNDMLTVIENTANYLSSYREAE